MLERTGIGRDATGRDRAAAQRPDETLVPVLALCRCLDIGERTMYRKLKDYQVPEEFGG